MAAAAAGITGEACGDNRAEVGTSAQRGVKISKKIEAVATVIISYFKFTNWRIAMADDSYKPYPQKDTINLKK